VAAISSLLLVAGVFSPLAGIAAAVYYYVKYRDAPEPKRHPSGLLYALGVLGIAILAFLVGCFAGISVACRNPAAGNLCGLWGFFVSGPLLATAAMMTFARLWAKNVLRPPQ
jgi:hypothetical protein